jgi:hypothetical protein
MSERHFRRLRDAFAAHGAERIIDRRRGRASGRRMPVEGIEGVLNEFAAVHIRERRVRCTTAPIGLL